MRHLIIVLALLCPAAAQERPARDPFLQWMDGIAQQQLDDRARKIAAIRNVEDAEQRKSQVRAKILELIGGLPDYKGPLNARVTGKVASGAYTIEKVIFDSLPGIYVTANLYRPNQAGRYPGVLLPLGHWDQGKPAVQQIAANLALKGFVVLTYDPHGQGERLQIYDHRLRASPVGGSTSQHFQAGAQSLLIGQSFARHRIWDGMRALDYLTSRPEVDTERIGCTGCSGGGTLTTYISALDPRVKVAAPACYMNSFRVLFSGSVGDSEQSLPDFLSSGLDQTDYVELFAPKPWLIASTLGDFFTPEGARQVYEEARKWYRIYGADEKIRWVIGPGGHGTPLEVREAIYEWFIRWLKDGQGNPREETVKLYPDHELYATASGQVAQEQGSRDLSAVILEDYRALQKPGSQADLIDYVRTLVKPVKGNLPWRVESETWENGLTRQQLRLEVERGLEIEGVLYMAGRDARRPGVLLVDSSALAAKFARAGAVALSLRPRGLPAPTATSRAFLGDWLANTRSWLIGRYLPAVRAHDILRGIDLLAEHKNVDSTHIRAYASEVRGFWLLLAAAIDPRVGGIWLDRTPHSMRAALENPIHTNLHDAVIPGFANRWDFSDLAAAMEKRGVLWTDPSDWMRRTVSLKGNYRYRHFEQTDDEFIRELLK